MSRNSSGTYTLPSGNPVVSGTLIEASWANTTLDDLASAMTDSLSRSGQGGMTAALRLYDGTSSVPGLAWGSETTTGWYRAGAGDMRLVVTGSEVMKYLATGVTITGTLGVSGAITATGGVTGNASTATALQTSRTIWGQSFNGTANVTGALTGVTDITASGNGSFGGTLAVTGASTFSGQTNTFENSTAYYPQLINRNKTADANGSYISLQKIRNTSIVQNGDVLGNVIFAGYDGASYLQGAFINALVSATPGTNDMPTDLVFGTTPDGGAGPSERMRITQAGNVGIGTSSPSARLHVTSSASGSYGAIIYNTSATGQGLTVRGGSTSSQDAFNVQTYDGGTSLFTVQGGGNVGIGTSSPSSRLTVSDATNTLLADINSSAASGAYMVWRTSGTIIADLGTAQNCFGTGGADTFAINGRGARSLVFGTNNTERARIDASGNLLVGKTGLTDTGAGFALAGTGSGVTGLSYFARDSGLVMSLNRTTTTGDILRLVYNSSQVGAISTNGSTTTYGTSSDYRLKENIAPMTGALAKVAQLKPVTYTWKASQLNDEGFIAHELAEVCPQAVTGEKDAVDADGNPIYQGIDTSFLVATLTAAIQELKAELDAANARITALEATP